MINQPRPEAWLPAVNHNYGGNIKGLTMGARLRLKQGIDIQTGGSQPMPLLHSKIITCLKEYGAIIADGETNFAIAALADSRLKILPWYFQETNGEGTFNLCNRFLIVKNDNPCISGNHFEVIDRVVSAGL